jgi:DnaJ like chaperone protein
MGKLIGAIAGFFIGGPIGAVVGFLLGMGLDHFRPNIHLGNPAEAQRAFLRSTFAVMGYVCKADGQVTRDEIAVAEQLMARFAFTPEQRREAIRQFNRGKGAHFELDTEMAEFRRACRGRADLMRMFLEVQLQAVMADGRVSSAERRAILDIARGLGLSQADMARLEAMLNAGGSQRGGTASPDELGKAYAELGVTRNASDSEVKKAYRHLMNQYHPDKLVSKGLPEEMMKTAEEKTRRIGAAYETIRQARRQAA